MHRSDLVFDECRVVSISKLTLCQLVDSSSVNLFLFVHTTAPIFGCFQVSDFDEKHGIFTVTIFCCFSRLFLLYT